MELAAYELAVIVGSNREGRSGHIVSAWFTEIVGRRNDVNLHVIDLAESDLPGHFPRDPGQAIDSVAEQLDRADAIVIVTPEYNHGYPASVKQVIDFTGEVWSTKPVGFVSYGGMSGGVRAVEQLRQVLPELHAMSVRISVAIANYFHYLNDHVEIHPPPVCEGAAESMLDELAWWARALREARLDLVQRR
jgi:NAD(P)H-dependent FMN reductase